MVAWVRGSAEQPVVVGAGVCGKLGLQPGGSVVRLLSTLFVLGACAPDVNVSPKPLEQAPRARAPFLRMGTGVFRALEGNLLLDLDAGGAHLRRSGQSATVDFSGWGRPGAIRPVTRSTPTCGEPCERLEFHHEGVVEWWVRQGPQVQQGWELSERPGGGEPLILRLSLDREAIVTPQRVDVGAWTLTGLAAWDALGQPLPAWFEPAREGVHLRVDDTGATWPITVDPLYGSARQTELSVGNSVRFGIAVAGGHDLNGDGYTDLVIGDDLADALPHDGVAGTHGLAHVFFGRAGGPLPTPTATLAGSTSAFGGFASCLTVANVNGDPWPDVVVVEPSGGDAANRVRVFHGGPGGTFDTTSDGGATTTYTGGCQVVSLNANGDVYEDVAVSTGGDIRVYHGSATGLVEPPALELTGEGVLAVFDHDGDGFDALLLSEVDGGGGAEGLVLFHDGSASGLEATPSFTLSRPGTSDFGSALGSAGDTNGDGHDDLVVSDITGNAAWVFYGTGSGLDTTSPTELVPTEDFGSWGGVVGTAGDVDNDGYDDVRISSSDLAPLRLVIHHGSAAGVSPTAAPRETLPVCRYTASTAGDLDGDNLDDVICGDYNSNRAWIYYGCADGDGDGWCADVDCDDQNAAIFPGAVEIVGDSVDQDCDGTVLCFADQDGDTYRTDETVVSTNLSCADAGEALSSAPPGDCDDTDASVRPGAGEAIGDGVDNDCDGFERCYVDGDMDGYRLNDTVDSDDLDCEDPGEAGANQRSGDCNDADAAIFPGAVELVGDEVDQDCDNSELCYVDGDRDGYRIEAMVDSNDTDCSDPGEATAATPGGDCNDLSGAINPGADERAGDHTDQNCDGMETCYADLDRDNYRTSDVITSTDTDCRDPGEAPAAMSPGDCDDGDSDVRPNAIEQAGDEVDQNCDGAELCYVDHDNDGFRTSATVPSADLDCQDSGEGLADQPGGDCDDTYAAVFPGAVELVGDGVDHDCDGTELCYADIDRDSYRTDEVIVSTDTDCFDPGEGRASTPAGDCDDSERDVHPDAAEVPGDGIDQDCDGLDVELVCLVDADGDGFPTDDTVVSDDADCDDPGELDDLGQELDCEDTDPAISPGAAETVGDGVDTNCDGTLVCFLDADEDGFHGGDTVVSTDLDCDDPMEADATGPGGDCDDTDATLFPGAVEVVADGIDQDCDGSDSTISCGADNDRDGARGEGLVVSLDADCDDPGETDPADPVVDCDDTDATVNPGAEEGVDDGIDANCDGMEACYADADGDGLRADTLVLSSSVDCSSVGVAGAGAPLDCDDHSVDADEDGLEDADEVFTWSTDPCEPDSDGDGLTDGEEVDLGTEPNLPDTDGGRVDDGAELANGTDPLDPTDDLAVVTGKDPDGCGCRSSGGLASMLWLLPLVWVRRSRGRATAH